MMELVVVPVVARVVAVDVGCVVVPVTATHHVDVDGVELNYNPRY